MAVQGLGESACCWSTHRALRVNAGEAGGAQDGRSKLVLIRLERIPGVRRGRKTLWILLAHERGGFCGCSHCLSDAVARALMPPADVRKIQTAGLTLHNQGQGFLQLLCDCSAVCCDSTEAFCWNLPCYRSRKVTSGKSMSCGPGMAMFMQ